jgi:hypothetical protein
MLLLFCCRWSLYLLKFRFTLLVCTVVQLFCCFLFLIKFLQWGPPLLYLWSKKGCRKSNKRGLQYQGAPNHNNKMTPLSNDIDSVLRDYTTLVKFVYIIAILHWLSFNFSIMLWFRFEADYSLGCSAILVFLLPPWVIKVVLRTSILDIVHVIFWLHEKNHNQLCHVLLLTLCYNQLQVTILELIS